MKISRPEDANKAVIGLSAAAVQAEFEIGEGTVTLVKFSSGNKPPVRGLLDKPMILKDLIKEMRVQGVDIFPDYDSHCYIEGKFNEHFVQLQIRHTLLRKANCKLPAYRYRD